MVGDLERRLVELRFIEGIEKVEHVPYPTGDQFWVRFNRPLDLGKLDGIVKKHGYVMVRYAKLPSKLPRGLAEMLWNGVTHVVAKKTSGWSKFTSFLGFEPEGIAKIANDLHGEYQIFMTTQEEGVQLLYEYLGLKYTPPAPPPPVPQLKPPTPAIPRPTPAVPKASAPASPPAAKPRPTQPAQPAPVQQLASQPPAATSKPADTATGQPKKDTTAQTTS